MRVDQLFAHGGTVTIMFTDLVDSTAITTAIGDARAQEYLRRHNSLLREEFATYSGLEVKGQGDGFMVVFTSARQALRCAIAIQRKLARYNADQPEHPIVVRMGLNLGEVISEGADFFGTAVILAARISARAQGEEIYVSALLRRVLESSGEFALRSIGSHALKGFPEEQEIFLVDWRSGATP
jgi:class 3 adenylate cyclase